MKSVIFKIFESIYRAKRTTNALIACIKSFNSNITKNERSNKLNSWKNIITNFHQLFDNEIMKFMKNAKLLRKKRIEFIHSINAIVRYFLIRTIDSKIKFSSNRQQFRKQIQNAQQNDTSNSRSMTFRQLTIWSISQQSKVENICLLRTTQYRSFKAREIKTSNLHRIKRRIVDHTKWTEEVARIKNYAMSEMIHSSHEKINFRISVDLFFNRYRIDLRCINVRTNQFSQKFFNQFSRKSINSKFFKCNKRFNQRLNRRFNQRFNRFFNQWLNQLNRQRINRHRINSHWVKHHRINCFRFNYQQINYFKNRLCFISTNSFN